MDDCDRQIKEIQRKGTQTSFIQRCISNVSDVFSTIWLRCIIQTNNGFKWVVLGSRCSLLLNFRLFLVILYLTYQAIK
jgi:hypothetical protein